MAPENLNLPAASNRLLPQQHQQRWTDLVSQQRALIESTDGSGLVFRVGPEHFALPTVAIQEILAAREIHTIPHRRGGVLLGVANCHGQLLTCASLRALLGISEPAHVAPDSANSPVTTTARNTPARLLVLNWRESRLGLTVDQVLGTVRFKMAFLQTAPPAVQARVGCIVGLLDWESKMVAVLDADRLIISATQSLA